jgi:hypothetical protein
MKSHSIYIDIVVKNLWLALKQLLHLSCLLWDIGNKSSKNHEGCIFIDGHLLSQAILIVEEDLDGRLNAIEAEVSLEACKLLQGCEDIQALVSGSFYCKTSTLI